MVILKEALETSFWQEKEFQNHALIVEFLGKIQGKTLHLAPPVPDLERDLKNIRETFGEVHDLVIVSFEELTRWLTMKRPEYITLGSRIALERPIIGPGYLLYDTTYLSNRRVLSSIGLYGSFFDLVSILGDDFSQQVKKEFDAIFGDPPLITGAALAGTTNFRNHVAGALVTLGANQLGPANAFVTIVNLFLSGNFLLKHTNMETAVLVA